MNKTRVIGISGWSGSGKTTLITKLIPLLSGRGVRIATLKHAHHTFNVDQPGKDSYEHRKSGACEVIVSSARRWVQMHEIADGTEATLSELPAAPVPLRPGVSRGFQARAPSEAGNLSRRRRQNAAASTGPPYCRRLQRSTIPRNQHSGRGPERHRGRRQSGARTLRTLGQGSRRTRTLGAVRHRRHDDGKDPIERGQRHQTPTVDAAPTAY